MKKEEIYKVLAKSFKEDQDILEKVATDVYYSGEAETILGDNKTLDRLFARWKTKKEVDAAQPKVAAESPDYCPICKMAMAAVLLTEERPAKWCRLHHVVFPVLPSKA